ncbi:MAG TPA: hypothetical protein VE523_00615 [Solirubrobacterales bacterium]|nr:hypothetical protein [Solirubrobacterales bacterium]
MTSRLHSTAAAVLASAALALTACGSEDDSEIPAACLGDVSSYESALAQAPAEARLDGETPISECLVPDQEGGQLASVGRQMVVTATRLNTDARRNPSGEQAVQLGYLVGAIERGAEGIHADLVRRVNSAARSSPEGLLPAEFERTFGEGYAAGLESG